MRFVCLAACVCLGAWGPPTVWSAPPDREPVVDQQQQLVEEQVTDDQRRKTVEEFVSKYDSLKNNFGDISGLRNAQRIATDQFSHLNRSRDARAAKFWELMDITVPLQQPLADSQRAELESFIKVFGKSSLGWDANKLLDEHKKLVQASLAKELLAKLQLQSISDLLSDLQLKGLHEIETTFSTTDSATVAKRYLGAHFNRQFREEVGNAGLLAPENAEQLASDRLIEVGRLYATRSDASLLLMKALAEIVEDYPGTLAGRQANAQVAEEAVQLASDRLTELWRRYGNRRDISRLQEALAKSVKDNPGTLAGRQANAQLAEVQQQLSAEAEQRLTEVGRLYGNGRAPSRLREALAEIVENYPDTQAGQTAKAQLAEVQKLLAAEAEQARAIRSYWDVVYPSRIKK